MPHRTHKYRDLCRVPRLVSRKERRTIPNYAVDPFWPEEDEPEYIDVDVDVPILDERGEEQYERCGKQSTGQCARCGRPHCDEHAPAEDRRCEDCEQAFHERETPAVPHLCALAAAGVGVTGMVWLLYTEGGRGLLVLLGLVLCAGAFTISKAWLRVVCFAVPAALVGIICALLVGDWIGLILIGIAAIGLMGIAAIDERLQRGHREAFLREVRRADARDIP